MSLHTNAQRAGTPRLPHGVVTIAAAVWTIALKDLRLLLRDRIALFWVLAFPLLFSYFIGAVMRVGVDRKIAPLHVAWVDESGGRGGPMRRALEEAGMALEPFTLAEARERVRTAQVVAWIRIPSQFPFGDEAIEIGRDPVRPTEASILEQWMRIGLAPKNLAASSTVQVRDAISRPNTTTGITLVLPAMILWALLGCSATFAVSVVVERSAGTLTRLRSAPIPQGAIVAGKALACFLACMCAAGVLSALAVLALGVSIAHPMRWIVALGCVSGCFTGITILLSVLGKTEQSVAGAGWAILIMLAMIGGAMVPLAFLPEWLVAISRFSPVRFAMLGLEGALLRGFSFRELLPTFGVLLGIGAVAFCAGALVIARQES